MPDFFSKSASPFSFPVPQEVQVTHLASQNLYPLICGYWCRDAHTPYQSQWNIIRLFAGYAEEKAIFFFFAVRLKPGRLLVQNYWCRLITIWHLRVKKWESLRVTENRRHTGSRWGCSISLIQPLLKPDPRLDPSDTWSNKSLCARILWVKFSKTCNQES